MEVTFEDWNVSASFNSTVSDVAATGEGEAAEGALPYTHVPQSLLMALLTLCTILGNLFIILVILSHPHLRRPSHLFIASLASTDLTLGLTVMVPRLVDELARKWIFGFFLCQAYHAMDVTLCTASILHLCCISLDRYFAIVNKPLLYYQRVTPSRVLCAVVVVWLLSLLTGFVPVFTGIYSSKEHLALSRLNPEVCDLVVNKYFSVIAGLISFWLPGSVMVWVYVKVYRETKRLQRSHLRVSLGEMRSNMRRCNSYDNDERSRNSSTANECRVHKAESSKSSEQAMTTFQLRPSPQRSSMSGSDDPAAKTPMHQLVVTVVDENSVGTELSPPPPDGDRRPKSSLLSVHSVAGLASTAGETDDQQQQRINRERESSAATTVGIVIGIFLVCWLPFFIWMPLVALLELYTPPFAYSVILWIGYGNSVVNPFIYGVFSREFRSVILMDYKRLVRK